MEEQTTTEHEMEWEKEYDSDGLSTAAPESNTQILSDGSTVGEGEGSEGDNNGSSSEYTNTQPSRTLSPAGTSEKPKEIDAIIFPNIFYKNGDEDHGNAAGFTSTQPSQKPSTSETSGNSRYTADQSEVNDSHSHHDDIPSSSNSLPELEQDDQEREHIETTRPPAQQHAWTLGWYRVIMRTRARRNESMISQHVIFLPIDTYVRVIQINGRRARIDWPVKGWISLYTPSGNYIMTESEHPNVMPDVISGASSSTSDMNSGTPSSSSEEKTADENTKGDEEASLDQKSEKESHSSTTQEPQTTEEPDVYKGFEESTTEIPRRFMGDTFRRNGAKHCVALTGVAAAGARIMMCIPSWDSRKVTIEVREGRSKNAFQKIVDLPFDAAKQIGKFTMEWLPDRIIWRANDNKIAELRDGSTSISIPNQPLHIKIFVAPFKPLAAVSTKFVQHSTHLFRARFTKMKPLNSDKTELFVLDRKRVHSRSFVVGLGMTILVILVAFILLTLGKGTHLMSAYEKPLLQEDFESCQVVG